MLVGIPGKQIPTWQCSGSLVICALHQRKKKMMQDWVERSLGTTVTIIEHSGMTQGTFTLRRPIKAILILVDKGKHLCPCTDQSVDTGCPVERSVTSGDITLFNSEESNSQNEPISERSAGRIPYHSMNVFNSQSGIWTCMTVLAIAHPLSHSYPLGLMISGSSSKIRWCLSSQGQLRREKLV